MTKYEADPYEPFKAEELQNTLEAATRLIVELHRFPREIPYWPGGSPTVYVPTPRHLVTVANDLDLGSLSRDDLDLADKALASLFDYLSGDGPALGEDASEFLNAAASLFGSVSRNLAGVHFAQKYS